MPKSVEVTIPPWDVERLIHPYVRSRVPDSMFEGGGIPRMFVSVGDGGLVVEVVKAGERFDHEMGWLERFRKGG